MPEINPRDVVLVFGGLFFAIVSFFIVMRAISKLYYPLSAPLSRIIIDENKDKIIPYLNGVGSLYAIFVVCAMTFSFTGGAIARFSLPIQQGNLTEADLQIIRSQLLYGFSIGIMVAALARIRAVYTSTSLAKRLELLTIATLGLLAFLLMVDFKLITVLIDVYVRPAGGKYFFSFALLVSAGSLAIVELLIYFGRTNPKTNMVPYSLVRERIEQQTEVEQIFWPSEVADFNKQTLSQIIEKDGLTEICWLTNTAPTDHIKVIRDSLKEWLFKYHKNIQDVDDCARNIISAVVRVMVSKKDVISGLKKTGVSRVYHLKEPLRVRLLIINAKCAIVNLPIPFTGHEDEHKDEHEDEQSNCATKISSPELVQALRAIFDDIWENRYAVETVEGLIWLAASKDINPLRIASITYENHHPTKINDLIQEISLRYNQSLTPQIVSGYITQLEGAQLLRKVGNDWVAPNRYAQTCRVADVFRRLGL